MLPEYLKKGENFKKYFEIIKASADINLPENLTKYVETQEDKDLMQSDIMWKTKKYSFRILLRVV